MYRKILVPVVEPPDVAPLVRLASYLLEPKGEILVLHVITARSMPETAKGWRASLRLVIPAHEAGAALDVTVTPEVKVAPDVAVEILERAESEKADAILMTLSGKGKRRQHLPFLGHTSTAILHHAACDVLIVNALALSMDHVGRVLVPTFTVHPPRKVMTAAEAVSTQMGGAPIVTVHLVEGRGTAVGEDADHQVRHPSHGTPLRLKTVLFPRGLFRRRGALPQTILEVLRREGYGLCLLGEDRGAGETPFLGRPFIEEFFSQAPCPTVILKG